MILKVNMFTNINKMIMINQIIWVLSLPIVIFASYKLIAFIYNKLEKKKVL
jgi:hypothetical protein